MRTPHGFASTRFAPRLAAVTGVAVRLTLLGAPWVEAGGVRADLTIDRPTSLLVLLALRRDWVRRSELAVLYRPEDDERTANAYLRKLVFRARQLPWARGLVVEQARLRWDVDTDVGTVRANAARGDHTAVVEAYAGPLLADADLPDVAGFLAWVDVERDALHALWRDAALRHVHACTEDGRFRMAQRCIERVLATDPSDEDAVQALIRLLVAQGRRHDAWSAFEAFRVRLASEMGVEPLEETLTMADTARDAPTEGAPEGVTGALPAVDGPLIGRREEIARVERWWADHAVRWVTICGLGGAGKTRLAVELARRAASAGERVAFATCEGLAHVDSVMLALAFALGLEPAGATAPVDQVAGYLRANPSLLVLDDIEPAVAVEVAFALDGVPRARVLATARQPLHVPDEWLVDVAGLASPPQDATNDPMEYEAVRFFLTRMERRAALPQTDVVALQAVAALCRRVDGMPLALELAATWTRVGPVEALLARLERDVGSLTTSTADVPERHRNIAAVIGVTLDLLTPAEAGALLGFAAYAAGFGLTATERSSQAGLANLLRLVNLGLVRRTPAGRYHLHALVRSVVWARGSDDQRGAARHAMRRHVADMLRRGAQDLKYHDERAAVERLAPEFEALRFAWSDALETADAAAIADMEEGLYLLLDARGAYHAGAAAFEAALQRIGDGAGSTTGSSMSEGGAEATVLPTSSPPAPPLPAKVVGRLRSRAGYFALRLGRTARAEALLRSAESLLAAAANGVDDSEAAFAVHNLGVLDLIAGRHEEARHRFEHALRAYERVDDAWGVSRAANNLCAIATLVSDWGEARTWGRRALEACERSGNQRGVAGAAINLGVASESLGAYDEAIGAYRMALETYQAIGDPRGEASAWTNLGHVAERRSDHAAARDAYGRSLLLKRGLGDPVATAVSLVNLADVLVRMGESEEGRVGIVEALRLAFDAGATTYVNRALWSAAMEREAAGDRASAARIVDVIAEHPASEVWLREETRALRASWARDHFVRDEPPATDEERSDPIGSIVRWTLTKYAGTKAA
ncbi:MAG: tetratricopeptide repeat protein [Trueperaceae bacterium]